MSCCLSYKNHGIIKQNYDFVKFTEGLIKICCNLQHLEILNIV